jgi:hypothetical protein
VTQNAVVAVDLQGDDNDDNGNNGASEARTQDRGNGNNGALPEEAAVREKPYISGKVTHVWTVR